MGTTSSLFLVKNAPGSNPDAHNPTCVVSVGYEGLTHRVFHRILKAFSPGHILDLRVSPSFRGIGYSAPRAMREFELRGIHYERPEPLWIEAPSDLDWFMSHTVLTRLAKHLQQARVLLLGNPCSFPGSDRERVVRALSKVRPVNVLFHDGCSWDRWYLSTYSECHTTPGNRQPETEPPTQLELPF